MVQNHQNKRFVDVLIISDIHLGLSLSRVDKLLEVLRQYEFKKLILNGDIFDGFNFKRLHSAHWGVLSFIRKLSKKCEVIWIIGNHDGNVNILSLLLGVQVFRHYTWRENGKKYLAIHGHQFDRFLHKNIIVSIGAIFLYNSILRLSGQSERVSEWLKKRSRKWLRMTREVAEGAIRYAKLKGADFIFCGHTHTADYKEKWGVRYYNSGSWVEIPSSYITILNGQIKIEKIV